MPLTFVELMLYKLFCNCNTMLQNVPPKHGPCGEDMSKRPTPDQDDCLCLCNYKLSQEFAASLSISTLQTWSTATATLAMVSKAFLRCQHGIQRRFCAMCPIQSMILINIWYPWIEDLFKWLWLMALIPESTVIHWSSWNILHFWMNYIIKTDVFRKHCTESPKHGFTHGLYHLLTRRICLSLNNEM